MSDVSRETRALVHRLFPLRVDEVYRYVDILKSTAVERGLIGSREAPRIWHRHVFNCAVLAPVFAADATVADVGSGAGLPGLVLALSRPDLRLTLIEPLRRRAVFLAEVIDELGLASVDLKRARAEELHGVVQFDAVTARAVAPVARLAQWTLPLCRPGGELVAMKGKGARDELEAAMPLLRRLSVSDATIEQHGEGVVSPPTTVLRIRSRGTMQLPARDGDRE